MAASTSTLCVVVLLLLAFFFPNGGKSQFLCKSFSCRGDRSPPVRFPFRLKNIQDYRCGYQPDFNLFCNNRSQTILTLPNAGELAVEMINYGLQSLKINDPDQCLPRRLLEESFNLQGSPFTFAYRSEDSIVLNCSYYVKQLPFDSVRKIKCMSGKNNTILAFPTRDYLAVNSSLSAPCHVMATRKLPLTGMALEDGMALHWSEPNCGKCVRHGGDCGIKSDSSADVECFNLPKSGIPRGAKYGLIIGVGIPGLLFLIGLGCYVCGKFKAFTRPNRPMTNLSISMGHQPTSVVAGLDGPTIESFPKTMLGSSRRLPKPNDNTCAICLSEYEPNETIRTIPECDHYFHANCIDEWLKLNATCPVCRNSPEDSSAATTPSSPISISSRSVASLSYHDL